MVLGGKLYILLVATNHHLEILMFKDLDRMRAEKELLKRTKEEASQRELIRKVLLRKLHRYGYWGGRHTGFDNLPKGFPTHLHGVVKEVAEELIKSGLLLEKPTSYGRRVSLNPSRKGDIESILAQP